MKTNQTIDYESWEVLLTAGMTDYVKSTESYGIVFTV